MNKEIQLGPVTNELIQSAMSYKAYLDFLDELFAAGKTTGENHSEDMLGYAKMNIQRMKRLNKTVQLNEKLSKTLEEFDQRSSPMVWLVITEGWCGDAAQNLPLLNKIAETSSKVELKLILRDQHLEVMDAFLTNGGRSIPKLITLKKESLETIGTWGPRPETAQGMVTEFKKDPNGDYNEFVKDVQLWYAKDKTQSQQIEMSGLLKEWQKRSNN